jgi:hypothetical protein
MLSENGKKMKSVFAVLKNNIIFYYKDETVNLLCIYHCVVEDTYGNALYR